MSKIKKKVVVVYSGGLDSTVLLTKCKQEFSEVVALNFDYGSKHNRNERQAARKITELLDVSFYEYDIPSICVAREVTKYRHMVEFLKSSLLKSDGKIPEGNYDDENMKSTIVPFRNGIMLSLAAGFAESRGFDVMAIANHAGDHVIYPDCRKTFIAYFEQVLFTGTYSHISIYSPFVDITKADIVKLGIELNAPLELTWSCYKGREKHCGLCGACLERISAFKANNFTDLVEYEIDIDWKN